MKKYQTETDTEPKKGGVIIRKGDNDKVYNKEQMDKYVEEIERMLNLHAGITGVDDE